MTNFIAFDNFSAKVQSFYIVFNQFSQTIQEVGN